MKKFFITILLTFFAFLSTNAHDYKTGIGLQGGFAQGVTLKHFVSEKSALEGIIANHWEEFEVKGLYEIHRRALQVDRLNGHADFGSQVIFWDGNDSTQLGFHHDRQEYCRIKR